MKARKKRITITLSPDVIKQIHDFQAWYMLKSNRGVSFSKIAEDLLLLGIKSLKKTEYHK